MATRGYVTDGFVPGFFRSLVAFFPLNESPILVGL